MLILIFASCVSREVAPTSLGENRLFPLGAYEQKITLKVPEEKGGTKTFSGVLSLKPEEVQIVALSFMNTTVFRIKEDLRSGTVTTDIYVDQLKKHKDKIQEYYNLLKQILITTKSGERAGQVEVRARDQSSRPTLMHVIPMGRDLKIEAYDQNSIPQKMSFATNQFEIEVETTGYKLGSK